MGALDEASKTFEFETAVGAGKKEKFYPRYRIKIELTLVLCHAIHNTDLSTFTVHVNNSIQNIWNILSSRSLVNSVYIKMKSSST
jgi:GH15 family glucan-1,4-alpha-glucosidase